MSAYVERFEVASIGIFCDGQQCSDTVSQVGSNAPPGSESSSPRSGSAMSVNRCYTTSRMGCRGAQQRHGSEGASPGLVVDVLIIWVAIEAIPWASDMLAAMVPHGSVGKARVSRSPALSGLMRKIRGRGAAESGEGEGSKALARASRRRPEWHEYQLTTVLVAGREVGQREGGTGGGCRRQRDDELRRSEDHDKLTKSGCLSGSMSLGGRLLVA